MLDLLFTSAILATLCGSICVVAGVASFPKRTRALLVFIGAALIAVGMVLLRAATEASAAV